MTTKSPLISIVLPTYNVEKYIDRCIMSLQAQDDAGFEMVFVDDCGQDSSMEIVERYGKTDARIRIVRYGANKGTFAARHHGVKAATGEYVFFLDPDDEIAPNSISIVRQAIESENPDLIVTAIRVMRSYKWYQKRQKRALPRNAVYPDIMKAAFLDVVPFWATAGKIYQRDILTNVLAEFESMDEPLLFGEDLIVYLSYANAAKKLVSLPAEIYWQHLNETSITQISSRSKSVLQLFQADRIMHIIEAKISSGVFSGPYAIEAAIRVKKQFYKNKRTACMGLLQDINRNFALGIFAQGDWRWAIRVITFFATLGKNGVRIWGKS